ncbi:hypothetical protein CLOP_g18728 [Closterium sp. NIES-67]|nr:hypothetical protein CLOP_g18728 [Closterium sp. NIES-67]
MWDVGAVLLGGFVPGFVVTKCVAVVGALAFSSWCAAIVVVAAGLHHIHWLLIVHWSKIGLTNSSFLPEALTN